MGELREGKSNPEIAQRLGISRDGVKYHVSEILGKLGVSDRHEAATWQPTPVPWWRTALSGFLAWPFDNLWWGAAAKVTAMAAVVATAVTLYPIPEGFDLFVSDNLSGSDVFLVTAEDMERLVSSSANDGGATWSPDCSRIAFASNRVTPSGGSKPGYRNIWVMDADGTNVTQLTDNPHPSGHPFWSPDGTRLTFTRGVVDKERGRIRSLNIYLVNADGGGEIRLTDGPGYKTGAQWSPDGKRMVLDVDLEGSTGAVSDPDANWEIYVMNSDGTGMSPHFPDQPRGCVVIR